MEEDGLLRREGSQGDGESVEALRIVERSDSRGVVEQVNVAMVFDVLRIRAG